MHLPVNLSILIMEKMLLLKSNFGPKTKKVIRWILRAHTLVQCAPFRCELPNEMKWNWTIWASCTRCSMCKKAQVKCYSNFIDTDWLQDEKFTCVRGRVLFTVMRWIRSLLLFYVLCFKVILSPYRYHSYYLLPRTVKLITAKKPFAFSTKYWKKANRSVQVWFKCPIFIDIISCVNLIFSVANNT